MLNQLPDDLIYYKLLLFLNCYDKLFLVNKNMNNLLSCKLYGIKCYSKSKVYYENNYWCSVCNTLEFKIINRLKKHQCTHFSELSRNELRNYCINIFKNSSLNYIICCDSIPGIIIEEKTELIENNIKN